MQWWKGQKPNQPQAKRQKPGALRRRQQRVLPVAQSRSTKSKNAIKPVSMKLEERKAAARQSRQCYRFLKGQHLGKDCKFKVQCGVEVREKRHHTLLHGDEAVIKAKSAYAVGQSVHVMSANESEHESDVLLMVVPVVVANWARTIETFAMLDGGSQITMVTDEIAKALKSTGPIRPLEVQWWQ